MCGIIGYVGPKQAADLLVTGLKRMEYRGYDSAGLSIVDDKGEVQTRKAVGKIEALAGVVEDSPVKGGIGIAHTRWATHGGVSEENTHPHSGCSGDFWVVHNGIVENYQGIKEKLIMEGHKFSSETDTEVIAHLVEKYYQGNLEKAVSDAIGQIEGTFGLVVMSKHEPGKLVVARRSSPIIIGMGKNEYVVASDTAAILEYTKKVVYLDDDEMAVINRKGVNFLNLSQEKLKKQSQMVEWSTQEVGKDGYEHYMLKEIYGQPSSLRRSMAGRLLLEDGAAKLGGLEGVKDRLSKIDRLLIIGCGTAFLSGMVGEYMLEEYAGIPVEMELAAEFRYRKPIIGKNTAAIFVSQSGETADTLAALAEVKRKGILSLGIVNTVGSSISRETDAGVYNHIGPEIGVASTKAFTSQLTIFALITLLMGRQRDMSITMGQRIAREIDKLPEYVDAILDRAEEVKKLAKKYYKYSDFLYVGRKYNYPIALEGALKLKEISYIHAEGYSAGEMKHGPIALIDKSFPTLGIAPSDSVYEKMISNLEEIKARKGPILAIATDGNREIKKITRDVIYIPKTLEMLAPILTVIPLQLFAYYCAVFKGLDVDKPRNLAKSVTVE